MGLRRKLNRSESVDREIQHHLDESVDFLMEEGLTREAAEREARRRFGDVHSVRNECQHIAAITERRMMVSAAASSVGRDICHALRMFRRAPTFTATVVLVLAVGIGANVAMFGVTHAALFRALGFPNPDRLVLGRTTLDGRLNPLVSLPDYYDHRDRSESFASLSVIREAALQHTVTGDAEPELVSGVYVSVNLFQTLGVVPAAGRLFTTNDAVPDAANVVMISHAYWQRRFDKASEVIGATIPIDGVEHTITGVTPAGFFFLHDADIWRPLRSVSGRNYYRWIVVGRLAPNVTLQQAQSESDVLAAQLALAYPESNTDKGLLLTPLQEALTEDHGPTLFLLSGAVALVLLIACGNVASLLLARGSQRRAELSVRAALGASFGRLMGQQLTESLLIAVVAGALGVTLAVWMQQFVLAILPMNSLGVRDIGISMPMLGFGLALSVGTALLFGCLPALSGAHANAAEDLKAGSRASSSRGATWTRSMLVVLQVVMSVVLLTGSGLLIRSLMRLRAVEIGFETQNLATTELRLPSSRYHAMAARAPFFSSLLDQVRNLPGIESAALIDRLPIRDAGTEWPLWMPDVPPTVISEAPPAYSRTVMPGYFGAMGIPFRSGRDFRNTDDLDSGLMVIVNEAIARAFFSDRDPIGRELSFNLYGEMATTATIVGVVENVRISSLTAEPGFQIYLPYAQKPTLRMSLIVRTRMPRADLVDALQAAVWANDPDIPLGGLAGLEEIIEASLWGERVLGGMVAIFAATALLLAAMGLYGVLAHYVVRRTREIGVRIALGAAAHRVVALVLVKGVGLVGMGLVIGVLCSLAATRLLRQQLFEVGPGDPATLAGVVVCFITVGTLACLLPAVRAARVDPLLALSAD